MTQVILCGIVKDEASCIEAVLDSFRPVVDKVVLVDTGSTDGTQAKVREWLKRTNTPGLIYDCPWSDLAEAKQLPRRKDGSPALFDFSVARNTACALAQTHATPRPDQCPRGDVADQVAWRSGDPYPGQWLLEIDGCFYLKGLVGELRGILERAPADVSAFDIMVRRIGEGTEIPYLRLRRVSACYPTNPTGWAWRLPIHETLWRDGRHQVGRLDGIWIDHYDTRDTLENRHRRLDRDREIFEEQIETLLAEGADKPTEQDALGTSKRGDLARAYMFLGQTFQNQGNHRAALDAYAKRCALEHMAPVEWGAASYRAGLMCVRLSEHPETPAVEAHDFRKKAATFFLNAHAIDGQPVSLWAYADLVGGEPGRRAAWLAFEAAKASAGRADAISYADAYVLAKFSAARSAAEVAARAKQMRLTGLDFEPWK